MLSEFSSEDFSVNKTLVITVMPCKYDMNHVLCGIFKWFRNAHHVCFCRRNVFTILLLQISKISIEVLRSFQKSFFCWIVELIAYRSTAKSFSSAIHVILGAAKFFMFFIFIFSL